MHIAAAGNVVVPAYLTLLAKGYAVEKHGEDAWFIATKGIASYAADDPLALLGLVTIGEVRGASWRASDQEIDDFFRRFEA